LARGFQPEGPRKARENNQGGFEMKSMEDEDKFGYTLYDRLYSVACGLREYADGIEQFIEQVKEQNLYFSDLESIIAGIESTALDLSDIYDEMPDVEETEVCAEVEDQGGSK
jgi:hypothetical protein